MEQEIAKFWSTKGAYGCFSNFSRHPIKIGGLLYKTTEHYYQSKKFEGTKYEKIVREAKGPKKAAIEGRDTKKPLRKDWEEVKEDVMYAALKAKFTQHLKCKETLLSTENMLIVEDSPYDCYWGWGKSHTGKNRLGHLLMRLRDELKNEQSL
jgi:ribA/ribD-fused uncharacterized protein